MSTYKELIYICLDLLKNKSDDSFYTEDHVIYLLDKFRIVLLEQKYSKTNMAIDDANYQTLCIPLQRDDDFSDLLCNTILKSSIKIPNIMNSSFLKIEPIKGIATNFTYVTWNRFPYTGYNEWLQNIIYFSDNNNYIYAKSNNPQFRELKSIKCKGVFTDTKEASKLQCDYNEDTSCNILEKVYPIEEGLIASLIELVIKELSTGLYKPSDDENNAKDDLSDLRTFIARNAKSNLQKQIDGNE